jgi:transcriptional regulator NrdR family protein
MNCPECQSETIVIDTRHVNGGRERKRRCDKGHISYTREIHLEKWDYVDPRKKRYTPKPKIESKLKSKKKKVSNDTDPKAEKPAPPEKTWKGFVITDETPAWVTKLWERTL